MQTAIAHPNYNLTSASVDRRSVLRSQLTRRRHSLAQETIATPAIAVNGNRVRMICSIPSRAMLTISQQRHQLSQSQAHFYPCNQRRFSSSASLAATAATTATAAASSGGNGANGTAGALPFTQIAIDSKIEQAMDLVKTHLMFAVREEVELLRTKIVELESAVIHLEAENSILREHVPQTVLQNLQPVSNNNNNSSSNNNITHSSGGGSGSDAALLGAAMASLAQPNLGHLQTA